MRARTFARIAIVLAAAFGASGCANTARPLRIERPASPAVTELDDVRLPRGSDCLIELTSGERVRGACDDVGGASVTVRVTDAAGAFTSRRLEPADVRLIAKVVGLSKSRRGWLGAAVGAVASLPLAISMFGDMMMPAAILGAVIGRATGDVRAEVVYERR
jgi:hypothetical protein